MANEGGGVVPRVLHSRLGERDRKAPRLNAPLAEPLRVDRLRQARARLLLFFDQRHRARKDGKAGESKRRARSLSQRSTRLGKKKNTS